MPKQKFLTLNGKTQSLSAWARELGLTRQALCDRLKRHPPHDALRDDEGRTVVNKRVYSMWVFCKDGQPRDVPAAAKYYKVHEATIRRWIQQGRFKMYRERERQPQGEHRCGHCGKPGCAVNRCPELYLAGRGGKRAPFSPPTEADFLALGIRPTAPGGARRGG